MITRFLFNSIRKNKGLAMAVLFYSLYSLGRMLMKEGSNPRGTHRQPVRKR